MLEGERVTQPAFALRYVNADADECAVVRAEGQGGSAAGDCAAVRVVAQHMQLAPARRVPQPYCLIRTAARQHTAVACEREREHRACVPFERTQLRAGRRVPQPDRVVGAAAREQAAIGGESDDRDVICVTCLYDQLWPPCQGGGGERKRQQGE